VASRLLLETGARQEHNKLNWDKFLSFRSAADLLGRALFLDVVCEVLAEQRGTDPKSMSGEFNLQ
jgi:hypothetical protein